MLQKPTQVSSSPLRETQKAGVKYVETNSWQQEGIEFGSSLVGSQSSEHFSYVILAFEYGLRDIRNLLPFRPPGPRYYYRCLGALQSCL
jgi:hypothetical protein